MTTALALRHTQEHLLQIATMFSYNDHWVGYQARSITSHASNPQKALNLPENVHKVKQNDNINQVQFLNKLLIIKSLSQHENKGVCRIEQVSECPPISDFQPHSPRAPQKWFAQVMCKPREGDRCSRKSTKELILNLVSGSGSQVTKSSHS